MADFTDLFKPGDKKQEPAAPPGAPASGGFLESFGSQPTPKQSEPAKSKLTSSIFGTSNVHTLSKKVSEAVETLTQVLPASVRESNMGKWTENYLTGLVEKGGEGALDFVTSPAGLGLIGAHFFPVTAPFAAMADLGMAAKGALQSIPDAVSLYRDRSPENAINLTMDLIMAKGMKEAGGRTLGKAIKGRERPGLDSTSVIEKVKSLPDQQMKMAGLESARRNTTGERLLEKVYKTPGLKNVASLVGVPKPAIVEISADIVKDRNRVFDTMDFNSNWLRHFLKKEVPAADRDITKLGYVLEGSKTADEVGLGPEARRWLPILQEHRRRMDQLAADAYGHEMPTLEAENYLAHIWDFGAQDPGTLTRAARALVNDPFRKRRSIGTYEQGMTGNWVDADGNPGRKLTPRYRDIADVLRVRDDFVAKAAANSRMADILRHMGVILTQDEYHSSGLTNWRQATEAHALDKATYAGKTERGQTVMRERPVYVHPDFYDATNAIFQSFRPSEGWEALETVRSMSKKLRLSFSLFHHNALAEQAQALDTFRAPSRLLKDIYLFNPDAWRGIRSGLWDLANKPQADLQAKDNVVARGRSGVSGIGRRIGSALGKDYDPPVMRLEREAAQDLIQSGLQLRSAEAETILAQRIGDMAHGANKFTRSLGKAAQPLMDVMHVWDKSLWDFYHQSMMIQSFYSILADEQAAALREGRPLSGQDLFKRKQAIAEHVNNAFGAVNYSNLLQSPKAIRFMNTALLAPAWTLSNLRIMSAPLENEAGIRLASKWAKGAAISWFLTTQMANYASTKYYDMPDKKGKKGGHFTWDNPGAPMRAFGMEIPGLSENALNIGAGYIPTYGKRGPERYLKLGRAFREPFLWMMDSAATFGNKLGQYPRMFAVQTTGHAPGSGYQEFDPRDVDWKQRVALLLSETVPIGLDEHREKAMHYLFPEKYPEPSGGSQVLSIPAGAGITMSRAIRAYQEAMDRGEEDAADMVLTAATANNLNPRQVISGYLRNKTKERKMAAPPGVLYDSTGKPVTPPAGPPSLFGGGQ